MRPGDHTGRGGRTGARGGAWPPRRPTFAAPHQPEFESAGLVREPPPDLEGCAADRIEQGYLTLDDDAIEVRVRRRGGRSTLAVKQGVGLVRLEEGIGSPTASTRSGLAAERSDLPATCTSLRGMMPTPTVTTDHEIQGADHEGVGFSVIVVDAAPGRGPALHRHDYAEVFVVHQGQATFLAGEDELTVRAGETVVVPAGVPHRFYNSGDGPLRQVDIHASPRFVTEWLEPRT
jgi:mannose-6-phosphate isomerase-like protein (cupin superfamily)